MRRNEEVERLRKEKARHNKEDSLSKEEEIASWTKTVEVLEKIYRDFYSYKDYRSGKFKPSPAWECEGDCSSRHRNARGYKYPKRRSKI
jgi:CRISPR/Cas system CSM-associated protein Csm2 small subunit